MGFVSGLLSIVTDVDGGGWGWLGWLLNFINSVVGNAAWTIILFTLLLKTIIFPLDFYSRYKMRKNAFIMEELKPQLEKVEKQCKGNKQLYQQRIQPILKKEGYSVGGACLPTLITLVLFFAVYSGLNAYAAYRNADTFSQMAEVYSRQHAIITAQPDSEDYDADRYIDRADYAEDDYDSYRNAVQQSIDPYLVEKFEQLNPGWLWIKNPWRPDVAYATGFLNFAANVNPIPTYEEFTHSGGKTNYGVGKITYNAGGDANAAKEAYNSIMGAVTEHYGTGNGYYALALIAVAVSFFSQLIMQKTQGAQQQQQMGAGMTKFMMILFPLMMGIFAFSSSSVFTLYIITNSTTALIATVVINFFVGKRLQTLKQRKESEIKYRRRQA